MVETAYVFIHLPRQLETTIAGRFELHSDNYAMPFRMTGGGMWRPNSMEVGSKPCLIASGCPQAIVWALFHSA